MNNKAIVSIILLFTSILFGATKDTILVHSPSMQKDIPAIVIVPDDYRNSQSQMDAVILLHGYGGDYSNWPQNTNLEKRADRFSMFIICPDGSPNSWYLDSPIDTSSQYETFMIQIFIPWLRENYQIDRIGITGLSMGGHGALYLAIRHPEVFNAVSSMSGGVDLTYSTVKWEIANKIGSFELYSDRWINHSVVNMVESIKDGFMPILIDCGYEDIFIEINRTLHSRLIENNIDHTYIEKPGGHSWTYWVETLDTHLSFLQNGLK